MQLTGSSNVMISKTATNDIAGLSALTIVSRLKIQAIVNGGYLIGAPHDVTNNRLFDFKNSNTNNNTFRYNTGLNSSLSFDVAGRPYDLNRFFTVGLRYTGSVIETWYDGVLINTSTAVTSNATFPTTATGNQGAWFLNTATSGTNHNASFAMLRVWPRSLSTQELLAAMMQEYGAGNEGSPSINLDFTQTSGLIDKLGATITISGTNSWTPIIGRGTVRNFGTCLNMSPSGAQVNASNSSTLNITSSTISFCMWFNPISYTGAFTNILTKGFLYGFKWSSTGHELYAYINTGTERAVVSSASIPLSTWSHAALTYDGSTLSLYINGSLSASSSVTGAQVDSSSFNFQIVTEPLYIDEVAIYSSALSATQIAQIYTSSTYPASGLSLLWRFDEGSGTSATDSSGNNNTGTITNAVYSTNTVM